MPTLAWIGKEAVADYHRKVPYQLLTPDEDLSVGARANGNLIVEGDNLAALKALLPYYAGQVKCIYIDPPYNTGKENEGRGWLYNDRVDSPIIREWLGRVVGKEAEDLSRHDKWLCMMYPRLQLLKRFLAPDGVMFISIDDTELPSLRILMDELFPHPDAKNRLACFVWQTDGNFDNQAKVKIAHEYVLAYSRKFENFPPPPVIDPSVGPDSKLFRDAIRNTVVKNGPKNPVSDLVIPSGFPADFEKGTIAARANSWPNYDADIVVVDGRTTNDVVARTGWSSKAILEEFIQNRFVPVLDTKKQLTRFVLTRTGAIENIKVRSAAQSHVVSIIRDVGSTQSTSELLAQMGIDFTYPKPVGLIAYLISMVADKNALVLDSFAGSGTTAHAVLELNRKDGGNRNFILAQLPFESAEQRERGFNICADVTARRVRSVVEGYTNLDDVAVEGLGSGFTYCRLGDELFDPSGRVSEPVTFQQLARHVFYVETRVALPDTHRFDSPLIGVHHDTAIYLLFNGILGDKTPQGGNILTRAALAQLPAFQGHKVVYCAGNRLGPDRLEAEKITVRQTPYMVDAE